MVLNQFPKHEAKSHVWFSLTGQSQWLSRRLLKNPQLRTIQKLNFSFCRTLRSAGLVSPVHTFSHCSSRFLLLLLCDFKYYKQGFTIRTLYSIYEAAAFTVFILFFWDSKVNMLGVDFWEDRYLPWGSRGP